MTAKQAIFWTLFWVVAACAFSGGVYHYQGAVKAAEFMNVYMIEKLLSFDNLFVFLLIFNHFNVPDNKRRKVLNYGIAGAVIFRAVCIGVGVVAVQQYIWILYILGLVLIYSAWGMAMGDEEDEDMSESKIIKFANSLNISPFIVWIIAIELSDIAFAIDSIPASLSISQDMLIVYSANIFAILGLRSFYFVIQSVYGFLPQLKYGIAVILAFIGVKMFLPPIGLHIEATTSLIIVMSILLLNIALIFLNRLRLI